MKLDHYLFWNILNISSPCHFYIFFDKFDDLFYQVAGNLSCLLRYIARMAAILNLHCQAEHYRLSVATRY